MTALYSGNLLDDRNGRPIEGAELWVYDSLGVEATLTDIADQPLTQPLTTDADGAFEYKATDGVYRHDFWKNSNKIYTDNRVVVGVPAVVDVAVGAFGQTLVANATAADARADLGVNSAAEISASGGSALVGFLQAGTGAVARTGQAKMRENVSVLDFGAVGDGVTNDTAAFQAAMTAAIAGNKTLLIPNPSVEYLITSSLDIVHSIANTKGVKICGGAFGAYYSNSGPVIKYTGTGYLFRVLGRNAGDGGVNAGSPMSVEISGLVMKRSGSAQGAVLIQRAWYVRVNNNSFYDFADTNYGAIVVNAVGTGEAFSGEVTIAENNFQSCGVNVFLTGFGGVLNVCRITNNKGLDQTYGVKSDFLPGAPYTSNIQIIGNHWEGTITSDIYSQGVAQGWLILGNYFEQNNLAQNGSRIRFEGTGNRGIVISGNTFFKELGAAGTSLVYIINGDGCSVFGNFSAYGGSTDRYSVDLVACVNSRAEVMTPPTGSSYPTRINNYRMDSGLVDTDFIKIASTGSGQFVGISSGDGYPGGTVCTTSNFYNKSNALITFNFKATITTKSAGGTSTLIGVLPIGNSSSDVVFPIKATNVTGTQPFYGVLPSGSTVATVYDATGAALNYQTAMSVGSILEGQFAYISQS